MKFSNPTERTGDRGTSFRYTLPKTHMFAPKNGGFQYESPNSRGLFSGVNSLLVSGSVSPVLKGVFHEHIGGEMAGYGR